MAKPAAAPVTVLIKDLRLGIDVLPRQIFGSVPRYLESVITCRRFRATRKIRTVTMNGKTLDTTLDPNFRNPIPRPIAEYDMDKTL